MNNKITLQNITESLMLKHSMERKDAEAFVKGMFDLIEDTLATEKLVKIKGFGTFKLIEVESRESVNVNTGERFIIEGHSKISFVPDSSLKNIINKPFSHFETVILNDDTNFEDTDIVEENPNDISSDESSEDLQDNNYESENDVDDKEEYDEDQLESHESIINEAIEENKSEEVAASEPEVENEKVEEAVSDEVTIEEVEETAAEEVTTEEVDEEVSTEEATVEEVTNEEVTTEEVTTEEVTTEEATTEEVTIEEVEETTENIEPNSPSEDLNINSEDFSNNDKSSLEDTISLNNKYKEFNNIDKESNKHIKHYSNEDRNINTILYLTIVLIVGFALYLFYNLNYKNSDFIETLPIEPVVIDSTTILKESNDSINDSIVIAPSLTKESVNKIDNSNKEKLKEESNTSEIKEKSANNKISDVKETSNSSKKDESNKKQEENSDKVSSNNYDENLDYTITGTKTTHTIKDGETIMRVALKYYGTKKLYRYILDYNKESLGEDGNKVLVGTKVKVPELKPIK